MEYEAIIKDFQIKLGKFYVLTLIKVRMLPYSKIIHEEIDIPLDGPNRYRIYKPGYRIRYIINNGALTVVDMISA